MANAELYGFTFTDGVRMLCQRAWPLVITFALAAVAALAFQYTRVESRYRVHLDLRIEPRREVPARLLALRPGTLFERLATSLPRRALGESSLAAIEQQIRVGRGVVLDRDTLKRCLSTEVLGGGVIRIACELPDPDLAEQALAAAKQVVVAQYAAMESMHYDIARQTVENEIADLESDRVRIEGEIQGLVA
ncbi:MAG: hypothetical protein ACOCX4_07545, partial [Planctomycetota bacterium]